MRWSPRLPRLGTRDRVEEGPAGTILGHARAATPATFETVGFWAAVLLPLCYVPLLAFGLRTGRDAVLLVALVALHLTALTAGHAHNRD